MPRCGTGGSTDAFSPRDRSGKTDPVRVRPRVASEVSGWESAKRLDRVKTNDLRLSSYLILAALAVGGIVLVVTPRHKKTVPARWPDPPPIVQKPSPPLGYPPEAGPKPGPFGKVGSRKTPPVPQEEGVGTSGGGIKDPEPPPPPPPPPRDRDFGLTVYSRDRAIVEGSSFPEGDQVLGELAAGDLKFAVAFKGQSLPRGKLTLEWTIDDVSLGPKPVLLGQVVEFRDEPTSGTYKVTLRLDKEEIRSFTFRITP